jgi:hypothetical protein
VFDVPVAQIAAVSTGAPRRTLAWLCKLPMRIHALNSRRRNVLTGVLLAMLLFRAYVPVGFMPASGTPFLLELCPAVSSGQMPAHHHHSTTHGHFENCPFGSAPAAGPVSQAIAFDAGAPAISYDATFADSRPLGADVRRAHRPRGPPLLA